MCKVTAGDELLFGDHEVNGFFWTLAEILELVDPADPHPTPCQATAGSPTAPTVTASGRTGI
jgi:hypothetical protein